MTTANLGLTLPTVGADSDTWGNELNTDLTTLDAALQGAIYGLALSAAGATATFGIAAGAASGMALGSAYTKTTSGWAVGTGNGSLDTGIIANSTWYHVWLIQRSDTGVIDILISLSATSPTMPTNYDRKRRIGSMMTDGSAHWIKFYQSVDDFLWDVSAQDIAAANPGTSAVLRTLSIPSGVIVTANVVAGVASDIGSILWLSSPNISDQVPSYTAGAASLNTSALYTGIGEFEVISNTSSQIRSRLSASDAGVTVYISTIGWRDARGKG